MRIKFLLWLLLPFMLAACGPLNTTPGTTAATVSNSFVVAFNLKGQDELDAHTDNQGCNINKKGCVAFEKGELGTISFYVRGPGVGKKCESDAPKPQYVITRVELSNVGVPATGKGDFTKDPDQWLRDSFPGTKTDGVVLEAPVADANSLVSIIDLNNHEGEKTIYYQITAEACLPGNGERVTDPMIENKGTN